MTNSLPAKKSIQNLKILFVYSDKRAAYLFEELKGKIPLLDVFHVELDLKKLSFWENLLICYLEIVFSMMKKGLFAKISRRMLYNSAIRRPAFIKKVSYEVTKHVNSMNPKPDLILQWQSLFAPYVGVPHIPLALIIDNYTDPPDSKIQKDKLRGWSTIYNESFYQFQKELYAHATRIFTMSKWCKEGLSREFNVDPQKVVAIGWGPAKKVKINWSQRKTEKTILAIGSDYEAKGFDVLLKSAKYLGDFTITIVGKDYKFKDTLVPKNVHILDRISDEALIRLFTKTELLFLFSRFEPSAHVLWEAQAYGCAVIGYDDFGISEAVVDNVTGLLLKTRDPFLVAGEIKKLYHDRAALNQMQKAAIKNYEKNGTWAGVSDKLIQNLRA